MRKHSRGFGLIEIMVALVLGLLISIGVIQIFAAARGTFASQNSSARMQEDARFVLSKMIQELRMTGMYGCLGTGSYPTGSLTAPEVSRVSTTALDTPVLWDNANKILTIITADIGTAGSSPTWTILSDCQSASHLYTGARTAGTGQTALPLRQLTYSLSNGTLSVQASGATAQPLLQNVTSLDVTFGMTGSPMTYSNNISAANAANIRSVRIGLTLNDPSGNARTQEYHVVAHLRNRLMD